MEDADARQLQHNEPGRGLEAGASGTRVESSGTGGRGGVATADTFDAGTAEVVFVRFCSRSRCRPFAHARL